jgi:DnaJ-class molecular chaperone
MTILHIFLSFLFLCTGVDGNWFGTSGSSICDKASDGGKTPVFSVEFKHEDGSQIEVSFLCGEDPAATAARIATGRRTRMQYSDSVLKLARQVQQKLDENSATQYVIPDKLIIGQDSQPRFLKTGGMYSRRAAEHANRKEFALAIADLTRALLRPKVDRVAADKLEAIMKDLLKKVEADNAAKAKDGDIADLFEDLEISDDSAEVKDIDAKMLKKVYRELSIKYHPDKNEAAAAKFNRIRDAYEVLSDPMKAMLFDTGGMELVRKYEGGGGDLDRTETEERNLHVTLEDIYKGTSRKVTNHRRVVCRSCRLHPQLPRCKKCQKCPPEKEVRQRWLNPHQFMEETVDVPSNDFCTTLRDDIDVSVERGMSVGERINFPHMGNQKPKKIAGDFQVSVWIKEHNFFKRIGNDLVVIVDVSLLEALMGFKRDLIHLDGHVVKFGMDQGAVLKPGVAIEIEGEGMPLREDPTSFGRLIVKFHVEFPDEIPQDAVGPLEAALLGAGLGRMQEAVDVTKKRSKPKRSEL